MKRNKLLETIGFRFIVDHDRKEVHTVKFINQKCHVDKMTNSGYWTKFNVNLLMLLPDNWDDDKVYYEFCKHCFLTKNNN